MRRLVRRIDQKLAYSAASSCDVTQRIPRGGATALTSEFATRVRAAAIVE